MVQERKRKQTDDHGDAAYQDGQYQRDDGDHGIRGGQRSLLGQYGKAP
jgi:hypothetical protein